MSLSKLPSGRWRAQVHDRATGKNVSVSKILGKGYESFPDKSSAKAARELARSQIGALTRDDTVWAWYQKWTTDPLYRRPKASTDLHNHARVKPFCEAHRDLPLRLVTDLTVAGWLSGGKKNGQIPALRAMFNDAASAKAGRLIDRNPWANLGITKSRGNRDKQPASEVMVWTLIEHAKAMNPAFAAWLQVAAFTGLRPGELDGLKWEDIDWDRSRIQVRRQFNTITRTFTTPKNGLTREALLTDQARAALLELKQDREFCFVNSRGDHFTASARAFHWKAVKAGAGWDGTLYLASRHFFGSYAVNVLLLAPEDVACLLGHTDGGHLVRVLYGHRSTADALDRGQAAFRNVGNVRPIRLPNRDTA